MLPRLVRVVNICIALIVLLVAFAVYWYALRPLPKTSGEIGAPISAAATVRRDARGIPHIQASSWEDAVFLQGYATAQDRLWQMDGLRRFAAGDLSEVFGSGALRQDELSRRMRMRAIAEADLARITPEERALFGEYARGVNYFIDTHKGGYSLEFSLPGHSYNPRPWTIVDSILVGLVMYRDLTDSAAADLERAQLFSMTPDPARFRVLFPPAQGGALSAAGSNAWAVSGAHTVDGKPMVANDPHLSYGIPCTWHLVHLQAPGLNVSGGALPGVPGVITGHNAQIAWGVTNLQSDVLDLYVEQIDPRTGRYLYQGHLEQARLDQQIIPVRGGTPHRLNTWVTRHGPVVALENGRGYSMRWSASDGFSFPFWAIDHAENWEQFRSALSTFWGPAQNFVYGDRAGHIGYQAAGRVPIRKNFDSNLPLDGASGKFEWAGYIPFEQMPNVYDPPSGIVATANQNPFPANYPYAVGGSYADPYRVRQVRNLLSSKEKLDVQDMLATQKDVYSAYDHFLARQAVDAIAKAGKDDAQLTAAADILRRWDGQMDMGESAPVITQLLGNEMGGSLVLSLAAPAKTPDPPKVQPTRGAQSVPEVNGSRTARVRGQFAPQTPPRPFVIETLLRTRPSGWVPHDDWDAWILARLSSALEQGRRRQGSPLSKWRWGHMLEWKFSHPVGSQLPFLDRFFDIGPVPMSGSGTTVKQTTTTLGPSERMVVDLGNLDRSEQNLPTGESGFVASGHYKDQWRAYYSGRSFPMEFDVVDAKETLRIRPQGDAKLKP